MKADNYDWIGNITDPSMIKIILQNGYMGTLSDPECVAIFCDEAIDLNPKIVEIYKKGKTQVIGKLIGHVMQRTNLAVEPPDLISKILEEKLK